MEQSLEILINATRITNDNFGAAADLVSTYEFVLNEKLQVVECVEVNSMAKETVKPIKNYSYALDGMLFELNHVRVNPRVDNTYMIKRLTQALNDIGVVVSNTPDTDSISLCFKPLGEISDNVRFYLGNRQQVIFLSPATKPKLVASGCN